MSRNLPCRVQPSTVRPDECLQRRVVRLQRADGAQPGRGDGCARASAR